MPIRINEDLPAKKILEKENIFVMDHTRALQQDIRPLRIVILNLMPLKEDTELHLLRSLANTPLQVDVSFIRTKSYQSKNTSRKHLEKFYTTFEKIKDKKFDGLIITGAPVELMEYEEVEYWQEMLDVMNWAEDNVTSTLHICWAAQAGLYHYYGIPKYQLQHKMFGVYEHHTYEKKQPLVRGFDDVFLAPHSRHTGVRLEDVEKIKDLRILADSEEAGPFIIMDKTGKKIFVMGHPEYDKLTLDKEYKRDVKKGMGIEVPINYYPSDNPELEPIRSWRCHANAFYSNWLNYYVYQITPYDL